MGINIVNIEKDEPTFPKKSKTFLNQSKNESKKQVDKCIQIHRENVEKDKNKENVKKNKQPKVAVPDFVWRHW